MSEENKEVVQPEVVDNSAIIAEYKNSKAYIDDTNALKGAWAESYRTEKLPDMVNKEVEARIKAKETKTPEQIRFDEYETKLTAMANQIAEKEKFEMRSKNKETARTKFKEAGLPDTLLDFFVSEDATKTDDNVIKAIEALTGFQTSIKQDVLGNNNIKVPGKTEDNTLNIDQAPEGLSKSEYVAWFKKNRK